LDWEPYADEAFRFSHRYRILVRQRPRRCTDVGKRTIAAIRLNHDDDPAWYNGPPYAVVESVFDEFDIEGCERAPKRPTFDATGRSEITTVPIRPGDRRLVKKRNGRGRVKVSV
jgi:hypothetical protein